MKHVFSILLFTAIVCSGCGTTKHFNAHINDPRSVESLRADVDFAHRKLEKLHPSLYRYISKKELDSIDSIRPQDLFLKYRPTFASDGFNTTFHEEFLVKNFSKYQSFETGLRDSVLCRVKWNNAQRDVWLKQPHLEKKNADSSKDLRKKKNIQGFDNRTQNFSKTLRFADPDSSIAMLTIRDFTKGKYGAFYKNSFQIIDSAHSKALVIDLRNNTGGDIADISTLYSYLAENEFKLVTPPMVTSRTSLVEETAQGKPFQR